MDSSSDSSKEKGQKAVRSTRYIYEESPRRVDFFIRAETQRRWAVVPVPNNGARNGGELTLRGRPSIGQSRQSEIDDNIKRLQNQVVELKFECKILQQARDNSVVVAAQMIKEIERLEGVLRSILQQKEELSKADSP
ncbi:uncharacterized protein PV07_00431 [Cladophialophora immunda]|uniref:Uncharacterized protein n=1 Tax=Cladophialophora immunda TaxID=569365 RepID=A0A0D2DD09_9EURO|nr:uncharacterized protein PV07_00431 [Cladophialophora immunda]KIW33594.1 hypothetical protein PV07_00431 [Cladophialophora immunda]